MVGRRNTHGIQTQCQHCGYTWLTTSQRAITSCPNCQWRVRLRPSPRNEIAPTPSYRTTPPAPPRYY